MWEEGAIISNKCNTGQYVALEDIWNKIPDMTEYISDSIIEDKVNKDYFERVYPDTLKGNIYRTSDQLKKVYKDSFKE